jgi:hypothetical protein
MSAVATSCKERFAVGQFWAMTDPLAKNKCFALR